MKVRNIIIVTIILNIIFVANVNAKEFFYINQYGVVFSKEEYNFLSDFYFEGYQNYMKIEDYIKFVNSNIMNKTIKTSIKDDESNIGEYGVSSLSAFHETSSKSIKISSACSNVCNISIVADWKKSPTIRSYDVIGAYLKNVTINISPSTSLYYSDGVISSSSTKKTSSGFGTSIKLPSTGENIKIVQTFIVEPSGIIYASYQHAKKVSTLAKSQNYSIDRNGYGGVFLFDRTVESYYDAMGGVSIEL